VIRALDPLALGLGWFCLLSFALAIALLVLVSLHRALTAPSGGGGLARTEHYARCDSWAPGLYDVNRVAPANREARHSGELLPFKARR
jgi:hypothetical protein